MKNLHYCIFICSLLASCMEEPEFHSFNVNLTINFDTELPGKFKENAKVVFSNQQKNYSLTGFADTSGNVVFSDVEPGFYTAQLTHAFVNESDASINVNGLKNIEVLSSVTDTINASVSAPSSFIIKEYYFSGCLTPAGNAYSADQFVEIYNNTADVHYVDGLSLLEHESYGLEPNYWDQPFLNLTDTIVCRMIWTIPGDGDDYPVQPGKSVVLARDAFDHKSDPMGNPLCPVDMGHADFEFFVFTASGGDIDGAYSTNLIEDLFTFRGNDVSFHVRGGSAIALAAIPGNDAERKDFIARHLILKGTTTSTRYYGKIPNNWVIDAVEAVFDEAHAVYKRFPIKLDAGYTYDPSSSKSGKSLRRKTKEVIDGRVVYQDTNNSIEDFVKSSIPKPWIYE